jgi:hypothetical protein
MIIQPSNQLLFRANRLAMEELWIGSYNNSTISLSYRAVSMTPQFRNVGLEKIV